VQQQAQKGIPQREEQQKLQQQQAQSRKQQQEQKKKSLRLNPDGSQNQQGS
jgi:hypothetical protein